MTTTCDAKFEPRSVRTVMHKFDPQASTVDPANFHRASIHLILLVDLVYTGRLYRLFNLPVVQTLLLGTCAALIIAYSIYAALRGYLGRTTLVACGVVLIGSQLYAFSALFGTRLEINAAFQFIWLLTFIIFFVVCREGQRKYCARVLFSYAKVYTLLYVVAALAYSLNLIPGQFLAPLVSDDPERGERLYSYLVVVAFAWFGCLQKASVRPKMIDVAMLTLCGTAFLLAQSRVITLLLLLLTAAFCLRRSTAVIRTLCLGILWAVTAVYLYGMVDVRWNPFALFAGDSSGNFRMWEYDVAREMLSRNPVSGVGFPPSQWHTWNFLNYDYFAAGDLGTIGVWFDWGLIGLALFMIGSHIACAKVGGVASRFRTAFFLTGCLMAAYGCIAPVIFYPAGATYFAILLGYWLDAYDSPDAIHRADTGRESVAAGSTSAS